MRTHKTIIPTNLLATASKITAPWQPAHVFTMNDSHSFKLATLNGSFIWHSHPDTDEVFYCLSGGPFRIEICTRAADPEDAAGIGADQIVELGEGDIFCVPRGVQHRPVADAETRVLLVEKVGTVNTGDREGAELTSYVDEGTK